MRTHTRVSVATTLVAVLAAALYAASASTAGAATDPLRLVLQRSDFPTKTLRWNAARYPSIDAYYAKAGFKVKSADYSADVSIGSTETVHVKGQVVVLASAAEARRMFAQYKRDIALTTRLARIVRLPAYGDEQSAFTQTDPGARADLRVRRGAVVWRVEIILGGTEKYTAAQALAQLTTYATKLKTRVGRG